MVHNDVTADVAKKNDMSPPSTTASPKSSVQAWIVEPGGPCNVYTWNDTQQRLILESVLRPDHPVRADVARLPLLPLPQHGAAAPSALRPGWMGPDLSQSGRQGPDVTAVPALLCLVLADPSLPPGTSVEVRLLGAISVECDGEHFPMRPANGEHAKNPEDDRVRDIAEWLAVGVLAMDPLWDSVHSLDDLTLAHWMRLDKTLYAGRMESLAESDADSTRLIPSRRLTAAETLALYRQARAEAQRGRRRANEQAWSAPGERLFAKPDMGHTSAVGQALVPPVHERGWRELHGVSLSDLRLLGPQVIAQAEHLTQFIPTRFARYLDELLLPDERVLFFAECPSLKVRGWDSQPQAHPGNTHPFASGNPIWRTLKGTRSRTLAAGIWLLTDQQALLVRDYAPPDATLVQWGYTARSWPLGRLVAVRALPVGTPFDEHVIASWDPQGHDRLCGVAPFDEAGAPPTLARLVVVLDGAYGYSVTGAAFPADGNALVSRGAALLARFLPLKEAAGGADHRVRYIPGVQSWRATEQEAEALASLGGMIPQATTAQLQQATLEVLTDGDDELVLVQARTPQRSAQTPARAALLTLTPRRLVIASEGGSGAGKKGASGCVQVHVYLLAHLTSVVLQHSLLGCGLILSCVSSEPNSQGQPPLETVSIAFPSPLIVPFRALFTRLRLLINQPPLPR